MIPEKKLSEIAFTQKGSFFFKTSPKNQFKPYEILNYIPHESLIIPLNRTSKNMHSMLNQHGYDLSKTHFIDIISKNINSPFTHKNTTYLQTINLENLSATIEKKINSLKPGTKTLIIDKIENLILHHGELKTLRFLDFIKKRMEYRNTRTIFLANNRKLTRNISKFLFNNCQEIIEETV